MSRPYLELGPNRKVAARSGSNDPGKVNNVPYSPKGPCPSENASQALFFSFPLDGGRSGRGWSGSPINFHSSFLSASAPLREKISFRIMNI